MPFASTRDRNSVVCVTQAEERDPIGIGLQELRLAQRALAGSKHRYCFTDTLECELVFFAGREKHISDVIDAGGARNRKPTFGAADRQHFRRKNLRVISDGLIAQARQQLLAANPRRESRRVVALWNPARARCALV